jgi:hypothetical protein
VGDSEGQQTRLPEAYEADQISAHVKERFRIQTWIGATVAFAAVASLLAIVILVAWLAIDGRPADYIESVLRPLQPFLLPAIGAVVGYALGIQEQR